MLIRRAHQPIVTTTILVAASLIASLAIASNPQNPESRTLSLKARPIVRQGDPLPLKIDVDLDRSKPIDCIELFRVHGLRIDDKSLSIQPNPETLSETANYEGSVSLSAEHGGFASPWPLPIEGGITEKLSPGRHMIRATLVLDRFDANAFVYDDSGHNMKLMRDTQQGRFAASTQPTSTQILPISTTFIICDAAHESPVTVVDSSLRAAVRAAVEIKPFRYDPKNRAIDFSVMFQYPPTAFNFRMTVRSARTGEILCMLDEVDCIAHSQSGISGALNPPNDISDKVNVIFEPDRTSARQHVENDPIWGESVIFNGLPIERATTKP